LWLSSKPEGTVAEIWLPVAHDAVETVEGCEELLVQTRPLTILLVDDEELVRAGTAEMLDELEHTIIEAGSGAAALQQIADEVQFGLVITDYLMPGMTGAELAAEIGRLRPNLPILLATGYATLAGNQTAALPLLPSLSASMSLPRGLPASSTASAAGGPACIGELT